MANLLNKSDFNSIRKELKDFEKKRESQIQGSREIIQISKHIINSVHRRDLTQAKLGINVIKSKLNKLQDGHYAYGMYSTAIQEYVEALTFYQFVKDGSLLTRKQLKVATEQYLLGLCDLTGELVRFAVNGVIREEYDSVYKTKDLVSEIYSEFLKFSLRNSELRKKFDSIKWNLKKLEDVIYDLKMKRK